MHDVPEGLYEFTAADCNRADYIQKYLSDHLIQTSIVPINGKRHIYVSFPSSSYNPMFRIKTVIVHYDRVPDSPGANDNSAAVFAVMDWAVKLNERHGIHNIRIFFTDGEELGSAGGVKEQGSFGIAMLFKKLGISSDDVYVFDACGRGTIPVIAKTIPEVGVSPSFRAQFNDLYERTQHLVRNVSPEKWLTLPVPYSDNAGFLACGIPAVAITLLPAEEADMYVRNLILNKNLEKMVTNHGIDIQRTAVQAFTGFDYKEKLPHTWRMFHTAQDTVDTLMPESFELMDNLLAALADNKTL